MATSLLLALLGPRDPKIQVPSDPDLRSLYDTWEAQKPERKELMMRLLYDVLHHSAMMGPESDLFGTVLARILTGDTGEETQEHIKRLRAHMKQGLSKHLTTLVAAAQPPHGSI